MKKKIVAILIAAIVCALPAWALDLKPGLYAITTKAEMQGLGMEMPATTMEQCITEQDPVPQAPEAQGCEIKDMNMSGNTVTYTMVCTQQGMTMESTGKTTYHGDSFDGETMMKMDGASGGMVMNTVIQGRRIGECQ